MSTAILQIARGLVHQGRDTGAVPCCWCGTLIARPWASLLTPTCARCAALKEIGEGKD